MKSPLASVSRRAGHLVALNLLITVLLVISLELALTVMFAVRDRLRMDNPVSEKYGDARLIQVYPGMSAPEIGQLLRETWSRELVSEPYTHFKEAPFKGRYVNVDANGF